jgi:hypothetical protein
MRFQGRPCSGSGAAINSSAVICSVVLTEMIVRPRTSES